MDSFVPVANLTPIAANDTIVSHFFGVVLPFVLMGFVAARSAMRQDARAVADHAF